MYSSYSVAAAVCSCFFPAFAALAVAIRFRARIAHNLKLGSDDWLIVSALVFAFSYCCIVLYGSFRASVGQDLSTITPVDYTNYQKHLYFGVIIAHLSYGFVKLSVLHFYKRIFTTQTFRLWVNVMFVVVCLFMIVATITQIFSAWPISNWWTLGKNYTINYGAFLTSFAAIDLFLDVIILCMPLPVIRKLHVKTRKKFLIMGIFWMGFFCVVATAVRLYFGYKLSLAGAGKPVSDEEFSYVSVNNIIWAEIESCCSVVAACLPTYGPIMRSIAIPSSILSSIQSLLNSVKRKSTARTSDSNSNVWIPLSGDRVKPASIRKGQDVEVGVVQSGEIRVQRSFATETHTQEG
ncbi:hypothetical protein K505DRAFT_420871 [Melanomma pulvis-pyrius CBS 109.77]|uniref:Rhodopsin domain-containing protein n=1 Tax=Melanomma pulvis-pyrius CBS 109.77 TaxID=1314802 RepID=A0A6A6WYK4_9PLEO|nr:hypothetical protein K505DRAFT_420871 [Melanomma pulvis-pyrius CBS 109.77]